MSVTPNVAAEPPAQSNIRVANVVVQRSTRTSRVAAIAFIPIIIALLLAPQWASRGTLSMLVEFFFYLALAQFWNLLAGFAGVVSLGQQAFVGLGGYMLFLLTMNFDFHPLLALVVAGIAGAIVAIPVAALVFRLQGAYLVIGTWVMSEVFRLGFSQVTTLGAGSGISLPVSVVKAVAIPPLTRDGVMYLIALILALLANFGAYFLLCARTGLALTAIRDNEPAARSSGVDSGRVKLFIFVAVALGTALTGALIYLTKFRISPPAAFDINWTVNTIFIVVIGGIGTLEGPIVGTILYFVLRQYLADLGSWYLIILGVVAVVVMLKMPLGLWGSFSKRFDIHVFPTRRRLVLDKEEMGELQEAGRRDAMGAAVPGAR
jgi:branched-chain amino acid transport system permease protein